MTAKEETKAVRDALAKAGINARVGHDTGTAYGWLRVNIGSGGQWGDHAAGKNTPCNSDRCLRCINMRAMKKATQEIIISITGRTGEHAGETLILTQDHWNEKKRASEPITHPNWQDRAEAAK